MAYLVVAYPTLAEDDRRWIDEYRRSNNQRYHPLIDAHFTLVFAISDITPDEFVGEIRTQVAGLERFDFLIKVATINRDDSGDFFHEFLVPDVGYSDIVKMHDRLYSRLFSPYLRFDIDFIPHIGIGDSDDAWTSKRRVDELNEAGLEVAGSIDAIDVIEYTGGVVTTIANIPLVAG